MQRFAHDVRLALRGFRRAPAFAAGTVAILALGIGVASAMAAITDAVLRRPLPVTAPGRIATVWPTRAGVEISLVSEDLDALRHSTRTMRAVAGFVHWGAFPFALVDGDRPMVLPQGRVTGNFFDVLDAKPVLGRLLRPADDVAGATPVIVLSYGTWRRHFGGDPAVLGRKLHLTSFGVDVSIVGVAPPGLDYPAGSAYWSPCATTGGCVVDLVARLMPGATPAAAGAEVLALMQRRDPELRVDGAETHALTDAVVGRVRPALVVLTVAAALLLLITCVNVGSLLLVRGAGRTRELAVRRAIGASTGDVARQLVVESAVLGVAGGVAGAAMATGLLRLLLLIAADRLPRADLVGRTGVPIAVCVAVTVLTVLLAGALPALATARAAPASPLRLDARAGRESRARRRARGGLVAVQMALAILMLAGAGLLSRSLARLERLDLGYRPDGLAFGQIVFHVPERGASGAEYMTYYGPRFEQVFARIRAIPGVVAVTPVLIPPFLGPNVWTWKPELPGRSAADAEATPMIPVELAGAEYFRTLGIPIVRGRGFLESDREGAPRVAVVSEAAARRLWPNESPIGKRLRYASLDSTAWRTVVGVVGDIHYRSLREASPTIFLPWRQSLNQGMFAFRTIGDPAAVFSAIRRAVHDVNPDFALWQPQTMDAYLAAPMAQPRTSALLLSGFAAVALLLAAVGLYGVLASTVGERTRELGVRSALGATPARLRRDVLGHALVVCGIGALVGLGAALVSSRVLASLLFEVSPVDPVAIVGAAALLFAVAIVAAWLPARRATRIDPARALRAD
ncbi:permease (plasmid) [Gemmatirosa kalamazoonensis]|uniref:Permease n=1 Tax=Gemmatirosa kalamazoonensis TaxID=861299 RepID=W0RSI6_9BACT|nr:ADOP family duplicated permease [Gemmatirosa kalamazoonensis]AHG93432.1 permease [Gemmatirosa kalamazoonensis]